METKELQFLYTLNELTQALCTSQDIGNFLKKVVTLIKQHISAKVCSIYLYDEIKNRLKLVVTDGLNPAIGEQIELGIHEGLVGQCFRSRQMVLSSCASQEPNYIHIEGFDNEKYDAFVAIPLFHGQEVIGVLVVQREREFPFNPSELLVIHAAGSHLASYLNHVRVSLYTEHTSPPSTILTNRLLPAHGVSEGCVQGRFIHWDRYRSGDYLFSHFEHDYSPYSWEDFQQALHKTENELQELEQNLKEQIPEMISMIFGAHLLILKDPQFIKEIELRIQKGEPVLPSILKVTQQLIDRFLNHKNPTIRERASDIRDVASRLIHHLVGGYSKLPDNLKGYIIYAHEIYPSEVVRFAFQQVGGLLSSVGGDTSHTSILARSFQIPMAIVDHPLIKQIPDHTLVILDATNHKVFLNPDQTLQDSYHHRTGIKPLIVPDTPLPKKTRCGHPFRILANINIIAELTDAEKVDADGIGLYRTEFPFLVRSNLPSEFDQINIYHQILERMGEKPVYFRTLDIGGDKALHYLSETFQGENPVIGMRSIRFSLAHPEILRTQLRAILRSAYLHPHVSIMFPMIASLEELRAAKKILDEAKEELRKEQIPFLETFDIGMMVEVPSAVELAPYFADEVDFFCIGSNDLTQFMLAVDRGNDLVREYFSPLHPGVLRAIYRVARVAKGKGIRIQICGEIASNPLAIPFLLGCGILDISVRPKDIPLIRAICAQCNLVECENLVQRITELPEQQLVLQLLHKEAEKYKAAFI